MATRNKTSFLTSGSNHKGPRRPPGGLPPYIWASVGGTTLLIGYGYFAFIDEAPLTKRRRWIATSPELERQLGDQEYRELVRRFRRDVLPPQHRASRTLERVGRRIADASFRFAAENRVGTFSPEVPFTYTVVRNDMANAFVLPGNHVFLFTGLFKYCRTEDDLAVVIGHEVAHNVARHAGEKLSGSFVINILARLSLIVDPSGFLLMFMIPAASILSELPNSRTQEMEADQIGVLLAAEACYDPRAAKRVFSNMKAGMEGGSPPEFLSTHPSHDTRISNFDKYMPAAMRVFEGDTGERCRAVRRHMELARMAAAQEAAYQYREGMRR
jgi:predicted Zn-dependent protease